MIRPQLADPQPATTGTSSTEAAATASRERPAPTRVSVSVAAAGPPPAAAAASSAAALAPASPRRGGALLGKKVADKSHKTNAHKPRGAALPRTAKYKSAWAHMLENIQDPTIRDYISVLRSKTLGSVLDALLSDKRDPGLKLFGIPESQAASATLLKIVSSAVQHPASSIGTVLDSAFKYAKVVQHKHAQQERAVKAKLDEVRDHYTDHFNAAMQGHLREERLRWEAEREELKRQLAAAQASKKQKKRSGTDSEQTANASKKARVDE